jgi:Glycosyl hydrolases family 38 N-terminal domain.
MRRFNFTYVQSSALYYQWLLEDDPQLFSEVRRLVDEVGGFSVLVGLRLMQTC